MLAKIIPWAGLILPWVSLLFLDSSTIGRYMPVALFVTVLNTIISQIAWYYKWWVILKPSFPWAPIADFSLVYCCFLVGTIWIFRFTFERFWLFILTNLIIDGVFAFVLTSFVQKAGIIKAVHISNVQTFLLMFCTSIVIYIYQLWQEDKLKTFSNK
ncbi:MAG: hypothetical protein Q8936_10745 [Bacillota bacterium]|nr:hypothetical protein [Bacillota bacterium]